MSEYKGLCSSVNYDGEPSVPMGISVPTSFVPPVHTPSASEAFERSLAPRSKSLPATALVCTWIITDLPLASDGAEHVSGCFASFIRRQSVSLQSSSLCCGLGPSRTQPGSRSVRRKPGWILDGLLLLLVSTGWAIRFRPDHAIAFPASGRTMSFSIRSASNWTPFFRIANMILSNLQAITISDCIFFSGFSVRVV